MESGLGYHIYNPKQKTFGLLHQEVFDDDDDKSVGEHEDLREDSGLRDLSSSKRLHDAIVKTQKNARIKVDEDTPNGGSVINYIKVDRGCQRRCSIGQSDIGRELLTKINSRGVSVD